MSKQQSAILGTVIAIVIGVLVALAGSAGSVEIGSVPVFAIGAILAFAVNWIAFVPSNAARTEQYYDLTGSITYLTVTVVAVLVSDDVDARALLVAALVVVWAARLGTFLFRRVRRDGRDGRFDTIKVDPLRFLMAWTLQGLWVLLTMACALAVITASERESFDVLAGVGLAVWVVGFAIEVVADQQKSAFKRDPDNAGRFISNGLWAWSRHPNYFGEIVLWTGVALIAIPVLSGWRWVMLISPVFVVVLLTRVSGIPLLEARAAKRWGDERAYQEYVRDTPVLIPRPPRG